MYVVARIIVASVLSGLLFGCGSPQRSLIPEDPKSSWNAENIRSNLALLNAPGSEGRGNGTRGFVQSSVFIASLLKSSGLQPILEQEYRHQYPSKITVVEKSNIWLAGKDTLQFIRGQDFLIHLPMGSPEIVFSPVAREKIDSGLYSEIRDVKSRKQVTLSTLHVSGIIPGRDPVKRDSLVWIFAPLDGFGLQGSNSYTDGSDTGIATAALLEVTRRIADMQQSWSFVGHSIMVSFLSGSRIECQGPQNAFKMIPWDKKHIKRVIILEDAPLSECPWTEMADAQGVMAPVLILSGMPPVVTSDSSTPFYPFILRSRLLEKSVMDALVAQSMDLSKQAMRLVLE